MGVHVVGWRHTRNAMSHVMQSYLRAGSCINVTEIEQKMIANNERNEKISPFGVLNNWEKTGPKFSRVGMSGKRVSKVKQGDSETAKVHASVNKMWVDEQARNMWLT